MDPGASLKILKFGQKAIFLPKFTVALIRTPKLSPYHAKFKVPLSFSKFDLRDYLFHAYNVRAVAIRSNIKYLPVRNQQDQGNQLVRPEPEKYMTVEMTEPFVWPANPKDWAPWGKKEKQEDERASADYMSSSQEAAMANMEEVKKQAADLLAAHKAEQRGVEGWEKKRTFKYISGEEDKYKIKV